MSNMSFSVSFRPPPPSESSREAGNFEEKPAYYDTLVIEACAALAEATGSSFHVGGFGDEYWPLDVAYDMSAFIEQLPELLAGLRAGQIVEVDLYPQGLERTLTFRPASDGLVMIHCHSRTDWVPDPEVEIALRDELIAMFLRLAQDFATGLRAINSGLAGVEPFTRWLSGQA
jgi:hypothetical protein